MYRSQYDKEATKRLSNIASAIALGIFLVLVVGLFLWGCASAQTDTIPEGTITGRTVCDEQGDTAITQVLPTLSEKLRQEVIRHEEIHVQQVKDFGQGCQAFMLRFKEDRRFAFTAEFDAYCRGLLESTLWANNSDKNFVIASLATHLFAHYDSRPLDYNGVETLIRMFCIRRE